MGSYESRPLGEVAGMLSGGTPSKSERSFWSGDVPWVSPKDMDAWLVVDAEDHVADRAIGNGTRLAPVGSTLIVVRSMTLGNRIQIGYVSREVAFNQDIKALVPKDFVDGRFLFYALAAARPSVADLVDEASHGTKRIQTDALEQLRIPIPAMREQQAIAALLGAVDDKIQLNSRTSKIIENLLRAFFASLFGVLNPDQAPDGWTVGALADHLEVTRGLSYNGAGLADDGVPLHCLDSIYEGGGYKYEGLKHYRGEYKDRHLARAGDLLVANTEQGFEFLLIGCPALVPQRFVDQSLFSADLFRVRPIQSSWLTTRFLYLALMSARLRQLVVGYSNGTTVNHLAADGLKRPRLALPPIDLVQCFDRATQPLFAKREQLQLENETLARLRDLLLPKLMSGEIRLKQAEKAVAEAG